MSGCLARAVLWLHGLERRSGALAGGAGGQRDQVLQDRSWAYSPPRGSGRRGIIDGLLRSTSALGVPQGRCPAAHPAGDRQQRPAENGMRLTWRLGTGRSLICSSGTPYFPGPNMPTSPLGGDGLQSRSWDWPSSSSWRRRAAGGHRSIGAEDDECGVILCVVVPEFRRRGWRPHYQRGDRF